MACVLYIDYCVKHLSFAQIVTEIDDERCVVVE